MNAIAASTTIEAAYQAAQNGAVMIDRSQMGMLKFTGESRLDLINRMSTNGVLNLSSGEGRATVLTTDIGRIVDRLILYASSNAVYALTGAGNGDNVARYLMRFVFFNDDFHIEDLSAQTAIWGVYGAQAQDMLASLLGPETVDLPLHHWRETSLHEVTVYVHRTDRVAGDGYFVMCQQQDSDGVLEALASAGIQPIDEAAFEYLRIESSLPLFGLEMTQDYIPLETGLWGDVSFKKGCYIGQEIIARMESRGRLAKKLVQLKLDVMAESMDAVTEGPGGRSVGTLTAVADGPQGVLALGYIKTRALEKGESLYVRGLPATVVES